MWQRFTPLVGNAAAVAGTSVEWVAHLLPQTLALSSERWLAITVPRAQSPREVIVLLVRSMCCSVALDASISEKT